MKKVGIVTFHRAHNYGAMLQAFALQTFLKKIYDTKIVDYHSKSMDVEYYGIKSFLDPFRKFMLKLHIFTKSISGKYEAFGKYENFKNSKFDLSDSYDLTSIKTANSSFDYFISGSDQVWNPYINKFDNTYFLNFVDDNKKYSYAASFGRSSFPNKLMKMIRTEISHYNNFSTRESTGTLILNSLGINKNVSVNCDSVFLLSKDEWIKEFKLSHTTKYGKYILVYYMVEQKYANKFALELSKKTGYKVLYVNNYNLLRHPKHMVNLYGVGPRDLLELILNAQYVVTTSFHGMAFSLIFKKNFYYELAKKKANVNSRLTDLSKRLNLTHLEINSSTTVDKKVDYAAVSKALTSYINDSKQLLKNLFNK